MPAEVVDQSSKSFRELLSNPTKLSDKPQPSITLYDGTKVPLLGLGTWNSEGRESKNAFKAAIYCGYRHIDTAANYLNEELVGEAIAECIDEKIIKREDLFITTKLWNNSHERKSVEKACRLSLKKLRLDYVDLYLVHYPMAYQEGDSWLPLDEQGNCIFTDTDYLETWRGMEDVKRLGLVRSIGLSNFNSEQISRVLENCSIKPSMLQVESHPYLNQSKLLQFCRSHGIAMTAYSPLGSPGRFDPRLQEPYLMEDPIIKFLAKKYQRSPAQILIRFQLQRNVVVVPKATKAAHIESNFQVLNFELSEDDMNKLESLDRNYRTLTFERGIAHKYYPFKAEY